MRDADTLRPITERPAWVAGIGSGLNVGRGAGEVATLAAEWFSASGSVVEIDRG